MLEGQHSGGYPSLPLLSGIAAADGLQMAVAVAIFNRLCSIFSSFPIAGTNMKSKLAILGLAMTSLVLVDQAQAQTLDNVLRGINRIGLLIEQLDEDAKECQITETLVRDAFTYPASGGRLVIANDPISLPFMYMKITTLLHKQSQLCSSNVDMRLQVHQGVKLDASGRNIFGTIELWWFRWSMV